MRFNRGPVGGGSRGRLEWVAEVFVWDGVSAFCGRAAVEVDGS